MAMKVVYEGVHEQLAIELLGWKWISFVGTPVKSDSDYPTKKRVRQFVSSRFLESDDWREFVRQCDARDANGDEPLAYCYCSSRGFECPPNMVILAEMRDE